MPPLIQRKPRRDRKHAKLLPPPKRVVYCDFGAGDKYTLSDLKLLRECIADPDTTVIAWSNDGASKAKLSFERMMGKTANLSLMKPHLNLDWINEHRKLYPKADIIFDSCPEEILHISLLMNWSFFQLIKPEE